MTLMVYGVNHTTAPVAVRECFAFDSSKLPGTLQRLIALSPATEAVLLNTCNRTEVYLETESVPAMHRWIRNHLKTYAHDMQKVGYVFQGEQAVQHLLKVAVGLDSMVLGEPQVLGQLKKAYQLAVQSQTVKESFQHLFPAIFSMAKQVRTDSEVGRNPVSLAYVVVQLAKQLFADIAPLRVILVGVGEMMELMGTYFHQHNVSELIVANRTLEKAQTMVDNFAARPIRIGDIPTYLSTADILVTATASQLPIIGKGMVEQVVAGRGGRPLMMVDLAVPRDIESGISVLDGVHLHDMDSLQQQIESNWQSRESAAKQARSMVAMQARRYERSKRIVNLSDTISQFRHKLEVQRDEALDRGLSALENGHDPKEVLSVLARTLTSKMLHQPTCSLREVAYHNRDDSLEIIKELFDLT